MTNYKKKYKGPNAGVPKAPAPSKTQKVAMAAFKGLKLANNIKNLINVEQKHSIHHITDGTTSASGTTDNLIQLSQGTGDQDNRIGDSILLKSMKVTGYIQERSTLPTEGILRMIIIRDHCGSIDHSNYLQLTGSKVSVLSRKNHDERFRSTKLYDRTFISTNDNPIKQFTINFRNINKHIRYSGTSATPTMNNIKLLMFWTDTNVLTSPQVNLYADSLYVDN